MERPGAPYRNIAALQWDDASTNPTELHWTFRKSSTVAILGRGRASISGVSSGSVQRAPRSQVVVPGGRGPEPPGAGGYEPRPQDATPRSAFGSSPETAPRGARMCEHLLQALQVVTS